MHFCVLSWKCGLCHFSVEEEQNVLLGARRVREWKVPLLTLSSNFDRQPSPQARVQRLPKSSLSVL